MVRRSQFRSLSFLVTSSFSLQFCGFRFPSRVSLIIISPLSPFVNTFFPLFSPFYLFTTFLPFSFNFLFLFYNARFNVVIVFTLFRLIFLFYIFKLKNIITKNKNPVCSFTLLIIRNIISTIFYISAPEYSLNFQYLAFIKNTRQ